MENLPNVIFNSSSRIYTNMDKIHIDPKLAKYSVALTSMSDMIKVTEEAGGVDIYVFMNLDSLEDLVPLQQKYNSDAYWGRLFFMRFVFANKVNIKTLSNLFREFHIKEQDNTFELMYAYTSQTIETRPKLFRNETIVPDDLVVKLLYKPIKWMSSENAKPGIEYMMDEMYNETTEKYMSWMKEWTTIYGYMTKIEGAEEEKNNLFMYEEILKHTVQNHFRSPHPKKTKVDFLKDRLMKTAMNYFKKRIQADPALFKTLDALKTQSPFTFPRQFLFNASLHEKLVSKEIWTKKPTMEKKVMSIFQMEPTFTDFAIKQNVLGKALTHVIQSISDMPESVEINGVVRDQMDRMAIKLNPFLPTTLLHENILYVMNVLFECPFYDHAKPLEKTLIQKAMADYNPDWACLKEKSSDDKETIFGLIYQYALHSNRIISETLVETRSSTKVKDVLKQMEHIRTMKQDTPKLVSAYFPMFDPVIGGLCESFFESLVIYRDLVDAFLVNDTPDGFRTKLVEFIGLPNDDDYKNKPSPANFPKRCEWLSETVVGHMLTVNHLPIPKLEYESYYNFLINLIRVYQTKEGARPFLHSFIKQFSQRSNLIPMDRYFDLETVSVPSGSMELMAEQSELRKLKIELQGPIAEEIKSITKKIGSGLEETEMNRVNVLIRFLGKKPRTTIVLPTLSSDDSKTYEESSYKRLYGIYKNRSRLLLTSHQIRILRLKMLDLIKAEVDKAPISIQQINSLLSGMNSFNLESISCMYSILNKMLTSFEKKTLFSKDATTPRFIFVSNEEASLLKKIKEHVEWITTLQNTDLNEFVLGMDISLLRPFCFNYPIRDSIQYLDNSTTREFIEEQVDQMIKQTELDTKNPFGNQEWLSYFKTHPAIRELFLTIREKYIIGYYQFPDNEYAVYQKFISDTLVFVHECMSQLKDTGAPESLQHLLRQIHCNLERCHWYFSLDESVYKDKIYMDIEKIEQILEFYLQRRSLFTTLYEINRTKNINAIREFQHELAEVSKAFSILKEFFTDEKEPRIITLYQSLLESTKKSILIQAISDGI